MSKEKAIQKFGIEMPEEIKENLQRISSDLAHVVTMQEDFKERKKEIIEQLAKNELIKELKDVKTKIKKLEYARKDLSGDMKGAYKLMFKDFMPGATFHQKMVAQMEIHLEESESDRKLLENRKIKN